MVIMCKLENFGFRHLYMVELVVKIHIFIAHVLQPTTSSTIVYNWGNLVDSILDISTFTF
jgi:hypothetical protein